MKWTLLASEPVLDTPWLLVERRHYRLPSGTEIPDYYVLSRSDFVLVVASDGDRIILVRQYRPATDTVYVSLPAGYLNLGENPEAAALRELREEAGITFDRAKVIGTLDPLPGYVRSRAYVVVATVAPANLAVVDYDEISEVFWAPWKEISKMIRRGSICEMQAVAALLLAREIETL